MSTVEVLLQTLKDRPELLDGAYFVKVTCHDRILVQPFVERRA